MDEALMEKATMFAKGRAGAVKRCGDPDDCFREGWFPTVAGKLVNAGDAKPTPRGAEQ